MRVPEKIFQIHSTGNVQLRLPSDASKNVDSTLTALGEILAKSPQLQQAVADASSSAAAVALLSRDAAPQLRVLKDAWVRLPMADRATIMNAINRDLGVGIAKALRAALGPLFELSATSNSGGLKTDQLNYAERALLTPSTQVTERDDDKQPQAPEREPLRLRDTWAGRTFKRATAASVLFGLVALAEPVFFPFFTAVALAMAVGSGIVHWRNR